MSHAILCDGCGKVLTASEIRIVAADATIKDNPDRMHLCNGCFEHACRFLGDLRAVQSGGIVDPSCGYAVKYLETLRQEAVDRDEKEGPQ